MPRISAASIPQTGAAASGLSGASNSPRRARPRGPLRQPTGVGEALLEQGVGDRGEQMGVAAGPDEVVGVGQLGGPRKARVDDHELAAALAQRPQPAAQVGRGEQRAVRGQRVGAEDQQVVGVVDVGDRHRQAGPEHQRRGDLLRHLIDARGTEDVAAAQPLEQGAQVDRPVQGVRVGVAEVGADRVPLAGGEDRCEARLDRLEGLPPARLDQLSVAAHQRCREAVGITVQLAEAGPFGQMKPREKTSSESPRTLLTRPPSSSISSPQVASHSGQVR